MCYQPTVWERCVEFHGHICPGLALGYKAAIIGLEMLGVERARDEELLVIVENDACGVDAIQLITGCTIGKGNLIYRDYGKQVYIFANRQTGETVRIAVKPNIMERDPNHRVLQTKVMQGTATAEEKELFGQKHRELTEKIRQMDNEQFGKAEKIEFQLPEKAKIFNTIICAECDEGAMESRVRVKNGKMVCLSCAGPEYSRGW